MMKQSNLREKYPLSFSQERIWFLSQLEPHNPAYNFSSAVQITGELNFPALQKALQMIVNRHAALRTTFRIDDGNPYQVIAETVQIEFPLIDISFLPEVERKALMRNLVQEETVYPFDLRQGPLIRSRVLKLGNQEHVLLISIHHIVWDAWSWWVMWRELSVLYNALQQAETPHLDPLPIQYAYYALLQRKGFKEEALQLQEAYWKQKFLGKIPILDLPTDRPRPTVQSYQGSSKSFTLEVELAEQLRKLALQTRTSLFIVLLAAFKVLLFRYSGQEDLIIGAPFAGRNYPNTKYLIGCFVNTLALRTNLSADMEFTELIMRVTETVSGAYNNQDYPFDRLVETINPDRDLSRSPLFQVMFMFRDILLDNITLSKLTLNTLEIESQTAKFDLTVCVSTASKELKVKFEYNTNLYNGTTIDRMMGHFETLLRSLVSAPQTRLNNLEILTKPEKNQLLLEWNKTTRKFEYDKCIHHLFEEQVEKTPENVAFEFEEQKITYAKLNTRANQLAHWLIKQGLKSEALVGICVERSLEMMVGLLGILKAGAAYVPIDPAYPQERIAFMLKDSQVSFLLTQEKLLTKLPEHKAKIVCLDYEWEVIHKENKKNPISRVTGNNLAYVIYTSGSTGQPKGVLGLHRGAVNRFNWMWQTFPFESGETCCQKTSLSFVDSIWEIFGPLLQGILTVIIPDTVLKDPYQLLQILANKSITRIVLVPSLLRILLNACPDLQSRLCRLKYWVTSGETLPIELLQYFQNIMPESILLNLYGSSEVSADATWYDTRECKSLCQVPLGHPIDNMQIYILDFHLQAIPIGVPGELHIGGVGLAGGYLNRPQLTEEKFILNPFNNTKSQLTNNPKSQISNRKLYKTGDLARYLPDGNIEFLGRIDNQVKIRGFRIGLREIETAIAQYPSIQQTVVTAQEDNPGDKRLVAYIVPHPEEALTPDELRRFLKQKLPDYMVPSAFVFLNALPLTPNGKIDQRALPAPDRLRQEPASTFVPPSDDLEIQLTKIWENVLGKKPISVKDNFFDLGGHSLLAVRLFAQIEKTFGKNLPLATLFQAPNIEELANIHRQKGWSAPWQTLVAIQPGGSKPPLFCIHPVGGNVLCYRDLAHYLGQEQPVYGLQAVGLDGKQAPYKRVEDMAAHYIREIRAFEPEGPYLLAGHSSAGMVAFEIAQQLVAGGQKVAVLALLDAYSPQSLVRELPPGRTLYINFLNLLRLRPEDKLPYIKQRAVWLHGRITRKIAKTFNLSMRRPSTEDSHPYALITEAFSQAIRDYVPQVYPGQATLFRTRHQPTGVYYDPLFGWGSLVAGGLEIRDVPGLHLTMLTEPCVQVLGENLRACIDEALEEVLEGHSSEPKKSTAEVE